MGRVLVVGGSNQVAAYLVPKLLERGHEVTVVSRRPRPPWIADHPRLTWAARWPEGPVDAHTLFHLAPLALIEPVATHLAACRRAILFSSTSAASKADSADPGERAVADGLRRGERDATARLEECGVVSTILRPTLIYGAGLDRNLTRAARWIQRIRVFPLLGPADGARQPVHAEDLAISAMAAAQSAEAAGRSYEVVGGTTLGYRDMIAHVFASLGLRSRFVPVPAWMIRLAVPPLRLLPRFRDLTPQVFERMNQDLAFDDSDARHDFGHDPKPFEPTAETWKRLDRRR